MSFPAHMRSGGRCQACTAFNDEPHRSGCLLVINAALLEALEAYGAIYRRVMEQANKIDSDVWYAVTKAEQKARAAIAQAKGDK